MAIAPRVIDLRSDTLTQPTAEMRKAMAEANTYGSPRQQRATLTGLLAEEHAA